jgi:hypothetical protein
LFFTKICMAVHRIDRARSIALLNPPSMDMCAPRRTGWIGDSPTRRTGEGPVSPFHRFAVSFLFTIGCSKPLGASQVF